MHSSIYLIEYTIRNLGKGVHFPQHKKMSSDYNYKSANSIYQLRPTKFPDKNPNLETILLSKGVSLTDAISSAPLPFFTMLISEKLKNLLIKFKLPEFRIYTPSILREGELIKDYSVIHFLYPNNIFNYINFKESIIYETELVSKKIVNKAKIESFDDFRHESVRLSKNVTGELRELHAELLVFKSDINLDFDLFFMPTLCFPVNFKVSQGIKDAIEKEGVTGLDLTPVSVDFPGTNSNSLKEKHYTIFKNTF